MSIGGDWAGWDHEVSDGPVNNHPGPDFAPREPAAPEPEADDPEAGG
jgi:hypothetical protein